MPGQWFIFMGRNCLFWRALEIGQDRVFHPCFTAIGTMHLAKEQKEYYEENY